MGWIALIFVCDASCRRLYCIQSFQPSKPIVETVVHVLNTKRRRSVNPTNLDGLWVSKLIVQNAELPHVIKNHPSSSTIVIMGKSLADEEIINQSKEITHPNMDVRTQRVLRNRTILGTSTVPPRRNTPAPAPIERTVSCYKAAQDADIVEDPNPQGASSLSLQQNDDILRQVQVDDTSVSSDSLTNILTYIVDTC
jgi:hypothetical protein